MHDINRKPRTGKRPNLRHWSMYNCVLCLPFNDGAGISAFDYSVCGNHGKLMNMANPPTAVSGWQGVNGLAFDGTDDSVKKTTTVYNRTNGQEISIAVWINPSRLAGQYQEIVASRDPSVYNWMLYQHTTGGSVQLHGTNQNKSTFIPTINQWTFIVATVNSAGVSKLYANGILVQTVTDYLFGSAATELAIGNYDSTEHYKGLIDDVRIFSAALSQAQIQQHYANGLPTHQNLVIK